MPYPQLKFGDISRIWGYLAAAAKAQQATRGPVQIASDTGRWVLIALHQPVDPPEQHLTNGKRQAKVAYDAVIHARNLFDGYRGRFATNDTQIRIQDSHAEKLIKICLYLQGRSAGQKDIGKALVILDASGWTDEIATVSQTYDGTLPN